MGIVFDVEHGLWVEEWGAKPDDPHEARARVAEILDDAPRLIPIFMHRAIPNEPLEAGNPVFSVDANRHHRLRRTTLSST